MNPKLYLQQIKKCDNQINNKLEEVASLRELSTSITNTLKTDIVQSSGAHDKMANAIARIVDLEREIDAEVDSFVSLKREVMSVIDQLDSPFVDILYKRYFQYKKWEEIAVEMNYGYRQVTRLHGAALKKVKDVLECPIASLV